MSNVNHYGAIYEGYINFPEDAVYRLSSLHHKVWIDDQLVIDNEGEVTKTPRHDTSIALAQGLHKVKVVSIGRIEGGWPTFWNRIGIQWQRIGVDEGMTYIPDDAYYSSAK